MRLASTMAVRYRYISSSEMFFTPTTSRIAWRTIDGQTSARKVTKMAMTVSDKCESAVADDVDGDHCG